MTLAAHIERPQLVFKDGLKKKNLFREKTHFLEKKKDAFVRSSSQKSNAQITPRKAKRK